ncbi:MAG: crotonase/enoyl-CoA hydratase family protein [Actinomycetota bacterium]
MTSASKFESTVLSITVEGAIATLTLDRPEARNAMGEQFFNDLPLAIAALNDDDDIRVALVNAAGPHFSVGLDLKAVAGTLGGGGASGKTSQATKAARFIASLKPWQQAITAIEESPKPFIAIVHGYCIGGGVDLIAACDVRYATADAIFSVREAKVAIVADLGSLQRLPKIIGSGHLSELALSGKDISAARALSIGLVNDLGDTLEATTALATELALEISANSPLVVAGTKAVLAAGETMTVAQGLDYVAVWNAGFLASDDLNEAMVAFMEKRPPIFNGR